MTKKDNLLMLLERIKKSVDYVDLPVNQASYILQDVRCMRDYIIKTKIN